MLRVVVGLAILLSLAACYETPSDPVSRFEGIAGGLGNISVWRWNTRGDQAVVVRASRAQVALTSEPREFDLSQPPDGLTVQVYVFEDGSEADYFMDDAPLTRPTAQWMATAGVAVISVSLDEVPEPPGSVRYTATVRLTSLVLGSPDGSRRVAVNDVTMDGVTVGGRIP